MSTEIKTGSQLIIEVGEKVYPRMGFNLDDPGRRKMYEKFFYVLSENHVKLAENGMKPYRGIMLQGSIGVGKTIMVRVMQTLFRDSPRRFKWVNCLDFADMVEEGMKPAEIKERYGKGLKVDLYIDDLGMGSGDMKRFGNVTNIVSDILFERDELQVSQGFLTHASSNVRSSVVSTAPPEVKSLERMYGDRILDRLKQMTNQLIWAGESLRK